MRCRVWVIAVATSNYLLCIKRLLVMWLLFTQRFCGRHVFLWSKAISVRWINISAKLQSIKRGITLNGAYFKLPSVFIKKFRNCKSFDVCPFMYAYSFSVKSQLEMVKPIFSKQVKEEERPRRKCTINV